MKVNFVDLKAQYKNIKDDILKAVRKSIKSANFILGPQVKEFEEKFARYCQVKYGIGVASGTDALFLALKSLGIGPGDEVITAANTFVATALAIAHTGATPVLVDIDSLTYNIDPQKIEAALTPNTKAVIPVHLYGQMADMDRIMALAKKYNLKVIEDACQAHGAEYKGRKAGSFGDLGCFSFYPSKNLGAYGDGGMVVTNREELYLQLKMLRDYGQPKKYYYQIKGYNSRLDSIQAAILLAKLPYLEKWNHKRRQWAQLYNHLLSKVDVITPAEDAACLHVWHLYVIRTKRRHELARYLQSKNIISGIHYPIPIHLQQAFCDLPYKKGYFPNSERLSEEALSLPMFPELTRAQIKYVVSHIKQFFQN